MDEKQYDVAAVKRRLNRYREKERDIDDPWYTGDFDATYQDVSAGCKGLLEHIRRSELG